ncbi:unnamed protein product [Phaedon cochleariae]|uniref:tRNA (uracil-O(2)-)-methyltransferase n=1 Tax=Phaedon cochleariae TaxID=80249 RepID=A0A9N9SDN5_PHACE|nr:unnamed protein product [Phaedon cochleariae]
MIKIKYFVTSAYLRNESRILFKYLIKQCDKLPTGPREHYRFMVKQSFKQHVNEKDQERINQIIQRAYEDSKWILKKSIPVSKFKEIFTPSAILYEKRRLDNFKNIGEDFIKNIIECYDRNVTLIPYTEQMFKEDSTGLFVSVRILLSKKNINHKSIEVVVLDKNTNSAIFTAVCEPGESVLAPPFIYELELNASNFRINLRDYEDAESTHAEWLADKLFPKLLKWSEIDTECRSTVKCLSLIPIDEYCILYSELKQKYAESLHKDWQSRAGTDPQKYIHEDLGIAAYLICFWRKYAFSSISFVDCGCGNGLLVYVLNQEGYEGYGIDIRRRDIWDLYPPETKLEVGTITPDSLFPESTWLIGNHSDELTPWLPVIALRSSPKTNCFLLPCCPFEFSGQKFIRKNTSISAYADYLLYIEEICKKCGYETKLDKLRIPSTRKSCLVGIRKGCDNDLGHVNLQVNCYIESQMKSQFKPRSVVEEVRNCTKLNRQFISYLVNVCVSFLLEEKNIISKQNGDIWNKGSELSISDISKKVSVADLKSLKNQCGGLQTLFRNHRYIFQVIQGMVILRIPSTIEQVGYKYIKKPCWFQKNHPNGCFNSREECAYEHS